MIAKLSDFRRLPGVGKTQNRAGGVPTNISWGQALRGDDEGGALISEIRFMVQTGLLLQILDMV